MHHTVRPTRVRVPPCQVEFEKRRASRDRAGDGHAHELRETAWRKAGARTQRHDVGGCDAVARIEIARRIQRAAARHQIRGFRRRACQASMTQRRLRLRGDAHQRRQLLGTARDGRVNRMRALPILSGSTVCGSSASTTKSASLPIVIDPLMDSSCEL